MTRWVVILVVLPLLFLPQSGSAQGDPPADTLTERAKTCPATICIPGKYEFRYRHASDFDVDSAGTKHGVVDAGSQRWRIRPRVVFAETVYLEAEADLVTGRVFGDTEPAVDGIEQRSAFSEPSSSALRQLYLSWRTPIGLLRIGQQTSHFGLGLLANNGSDEAHDVFDDPNQGDISERALFATKPLKWLGNDLGNNLILAGGFDVVFRDDNADLTQGDLAMQGLVSLMYRSKSLTAGVYVAFRDQEDDDGDKLEARAYDVFAKWSHEIASKMTFTVAAEVAVVQGHTTRVALEQAKEGVDVIGLGAALQTSLRFDDLGLETRLEAGYATGDNNRNDDTVRQFKFDPGYHVGMILFREVIARISANTVRLASDPEVSGQPPKGVEQVATDGAITNAMYVNPVIRWRSKFGLRADVGAVMAWSVADFTDPWQSALHGGYNYNYLGARAQSSYLGLELDAGISYVMNLKNAATFSVGVQGGLFLPGSAFDAPDGGKSLGNVAKIRTLFDIGW